MNSGRNWIRYLGRNQRYSSSDADVDVLNQNVNYQKSRFWKYSLYYIGHIWGNHKKQKYWKCRQACDWTNWIWLNYFWQEYELRRK